MWFLPRGTCSLVRSWTEINQSHKWVFNYNISIGLWRNKARCCERAHIERPDLVQVLGRASLGCHLAMTESRETEAGCFGGSKKRHWELKDRKEAWLKPREWGDMRWMIQGLVGREMKTFGEIAMGSHWRVFSRGIMWAYLFYKTPASVWRVDWSEATNGVGNQVIYGMWLVPGSCSAFIASHHWT